MWLCTMDTCPVCLLKQLFSLKEEALQVEAQHLSEASEKEQERLQGSHKASLRENACLKGSPVGQMDLKSF